MIEALKRHWALRSPREQRLLIVMLALSTALLAWLLVIRPLNDALSLARERHAQAAVRLGEARALAGQAAQSRPQRALRLDAPLHQLLARSAAAAGLEPTRVDGRGPGEATLVLPAVRPQAFFSWLAGVEARDGLQVERLAANPSGNQTLAVEVTVRIGSGR